MYQRMHAIASPGTIRIVAMTARTADAVTKAICINVRIMPKPRSRWAGGIEPEGQFPLRTKGGPFFLKEISDEAEGSIGRREAAPRPPPRSAPRHRMPRARPEKAAGSF